MPPRRSRGGAPRSLRLSARTSTPVVKQDLSDDEMVDADAVDAQATPPPDDEDVATPAQDEDAQDDDDAESPPVIQSMPRRRGRPGRPRLHRPDVATPEPGTDDVSDSGTPQRRRRGRPSGAGWRGGFRGRPKWAPSGPASRVAIDKEGTMADVVNDEVDLPEDEEGETKVDKNGLLQGDRDYRVRVFTIQGRDDRLYMLSTEPARCTGFRDSYLFFNKHPTLYKIILGEEEKRDLIARDIIPHSYKGRSIGVVTARSVFREFGSRIVIGGKKIVDDYQVQAARERGDVEGEVTDLNDRLPPPGEPYNKNQYVAWHGASQVYHNNAPSVPVPTGRPVTSKRKTNVTTVNWQFEHAREASRFNTTLTGLRRANLDGVYDAHTNLLLYPKIMQPSHVKWENIPTPSEHLTRQKSTKLTGEDNLANGDSHEDDTTALQPSPTKATIFSPVTRIVSRNFLVTDLHFQSPPVANLGLPGPDGDIEDLGPNGLTSVPQHVLDDLPADCRAAFDEARRREVRWKTGWGTEGTDGARGELRIGFNGFPV